MDPSKALQLETIHPYPQMRHFQAENISRKIIPNSASLHGDVSIHLCTLRSKISTSSGNGKFETKKKTAQAGLKAHICFLVVHSKIWRQVGSSFPAHWPETKPHQVVFPGNWKIGQTKPTKKNQWGPAFRRKRPKKAIQKAIQRKQRMKGCIRETWPDAVGMAFQWKGPPRRGRVSEFSVVICGTCKG